MQASDNVYTVYVKWEAIPVLLYLIQRQCLVNHMLFHCTSGAGEEKVIVLLWPLQTKICIKYLFYFDTHNH
jgi:hypothetical protein